jgi:CO dehydrogenase/acetyl-CoA synthase beta subunit
MTQKTNQNPWTMDVRVRERNLKSGALTDKDLEKYLSSLPDLAEQAEPFSTAQPALAQQQQHHHQQQQHHPQVTASVAAEPEAEEAEEEADAETNEPAAPSHPVLNGAGEATDVTGAADASASGSTSEGEPT